MRVFSKTVDQFIAISYEIEQELTDSNVMPNQISFIPNGVDTNTYKPVTSEEKAKLRTDLDLPDEKLVIFVGRLVKVKNIERLLTIWKEIMPSDTHLILVGAGPEEEHLRTIATDPVHFIGQVNNVVSYLQAGDLFILPSKAEGLSNAMLEAMATGLPVIVTNIGGAPDLITLDCGWLVEPDDPLALKHALSDALDHSVEQLQQMGLSAREQILKQYSLEQTADKLRVLYETFTHN